MNEGGARKAISDGLIPRRQDYPELPAECKVWDLLEVCWQMEPSARPTMSDIFPKIFKETTTLPPVL
ncbi:hypothetical protein FRB98_004251 [Tulasnella sp. 332]|nr:hypothetical protein FRB98_004251 [Tulasnella sp. 332]